MFRAALLFLVVCLTALAPARAQDRDQATLKLLATLGENGAPVDSGVVWRIFDARTLPDGSRPVIIESALSHPVASLPPGDYIIHAAFGLASAMKSVTLLAGDSRSLTLPIAAGALRIAATRDNAPLDPASVQIAIYVPDRNDAEANLVYSKARLGETIGVPEGPYHIVSTYLDSVGVGALGGAKTANGANAPTPSNSIASGDVRVGAGKMVDVTLRHRFATLTLKLVKAAGGEALANSTFTVLTPGGDIVRELIGAFPSLVLAEGQYIVIARHDAKTFQATFDVKSGMDRDVEILAKETTAQEQ